MQNQSHNTRMAVPRTNSFSNCVNPHYPPHPHNPKDYARPPIALNSQNRPASHHLYSNGSESQGGPNHTAYMHHPRQLHIQAMGRNGPYLQEKITINISHASHMARSNQKQEGTHRKIVSHYSSSNSTGKHPLHTSTIVPNAPGFSQFHPRPSDKIFEKKPSQFFSNSESQNLNVPELRFGSSEKESNTEGGRLNKTDRDEPNKRFPVDPFFQKRRQTKKLSMGDPTRKYQLDSTVHTESSQPFIPKQPAFKAQNQGDLLKKSFSPSNIWPLSNSPSEEKRQNVFYDPFIGVESQKKISMVQDGPNQEFKKKKNFEFFKNLKKKQSIVIYEEVKLQKLWTINDFDLLDKIGKGAFGDVFMAQEKASGFLCVLKKLSKKKINQKNIAEHLVRQIKVQTFLDHRHLTPLYGFFSDESFVYLILEYMPDGSLTQAIKKKKIPEQRASLYVRQICLGLKYMHTERIIHRDIKPQNIFLFENYAKLGDFGCSVYTLTLRNTQIGSFAYISPEQLKLESYNQKIDVWSVGVMTYEMLFGVSPFEADIIKIAKQEKPPELSELKFPSNVEISSEAKDFLTKMLKPDPEDRIGIDEAIRHQFVLRYIRSEEPSDSSPS